MEFANSRNKTFKFDVMFSLKLSESTQSSYLMLVIRRDTTRAKETDTLSCEQKTNVCLPANGAFQKSALNEYETQYKSWSILSLSLSPLYRHDGFAARAHEYMSD